jgi:hypothetical protein
LRRHNVSKVQPTGVDANQFLSGNGRWIWDILLLEHVWST